MNANPVKFNAIPAWTLPTTPDSLALFECIALAGLEGQWIRLDAATQRAIMGANVFGKQQIRIDADGELCVRRSTCFGTMFEVGHPLLANLRRAIAESLRLSPGVFGQGYLSC
jgi:hypothetical protein